MKRQIKFRFWCISEKRFIDDPKISKNGYITVMDGIAGTEACDDDVIALQFTGVKDADGVEIYDGDVVETIYDIKGKVFYSNDLGAFRIIADDKICYALVTMRTVERDDNTPPRSNLLVVVKKVVGNIFENP